MIFNDLYLQILDSAWESTVRKLQISVTHFKGYCYPHFFRFLHFFALKAFVLLSHLLPYLSTFTLFTIFT